MISVCPNCEAEVSVPDGSQLGQEFVCPHCQAQFELKEVFQQDARDLKPVGDDMFTPDLEVGEVPAEDSLIETPLGFEPDTGPIEIEAPDFEAAEEPIDQVVDSAADAGDSGMETATDLLSAGATAVSGVDAAAAGAMASGGNDGDEPAPGEDAAIGAADDIEIDLDELEADLAEAEPVEFGLTADDGVDGMSEPIPESTFGDTEAIDFSLEAGDSTVSKEVGQEPADVTDAVPDDGASSVAGDSGHVAVVKPFDVPPASFRGETFRPRLPGRRGSRWLGLAKMVSGILVALILAQVFLWWGLKKDPLGFAAKLGPLSSLAPPSLRSPSLPPPVTTTPTIAAKPDVSNAVADTKPALPATDDAFPTVLPDELTVLRAPAYVATDVSLPLAAAKVSQAEFDAAMGGPTSAQEKIDKAISFYTACCELAEKATFAESSEIHAMQGEIDELLQSAAANGMAVVMGRLPRNRMQELPSGKGICLSGTVRASRPIQGGVQHAIQLLDKPGRLGPTIIGVQAVDPTEPAVAPLPGSRVIVLGVLVNHPDTELTSYESGGKPVVWIGQIIPIP